MTKLIFLYGTVSGLVVILTAIFGLHTSEWIGYLVMFIAFSSIFFAVKQYRDDVLGGVIRFDTACFLGLGITFVASIVYVAVWEVQLALTDYAFIDDYVDGHIASLQASGLSDAELEKRVAEAEDMRRQYGNPLFRLPLTFIEIFPVGLLISLVSAFVLKDSKVLPAVRAEQH